MQRHIVGKVEDCRPANGKLYRWEVREALVCLTLTERFTH